MNYSQLFNSLYETYLKDPSNEKAWNDIMKSTKEFRSKMINSSKLYSVYKEEADAELMTVIYNAFETYDVSRGASVYTWVYRLCSQSIWRMIKTFSDGYFVSEAVNEEGETVNAVEYYDNMTQYDNEFEFFDEKDTDYYAKAFEILTQVLGNGLEFEMLSKKRGIFGEQKMRNKEIADRDIFDYKSIKYLNNKINNKLYMLRKYIKETGISIEDFNIKDFEEWKKH